MIYTKEELTEMIHRLREQLADLEEDYQKLKVHQQKPYTLLNDYEIASLATEGMIIPFHDGLIREHYGKGLLSFGLSSFGYDIRLSDGILIADTAEIPEHMEDFVLDPKAFNPIGFYEAKASDDGSIVIPPYGFALGESVEYFNMPPDVFGIALGKSTYARSGVLVNMVTPLEPGWSGTLTLEIFNATPFWTKVYAGEGIGQIVFLKGNRPMTTYDSRKGKYMEQEGITLPRI